MKNLILGLVQKLKQSREQKRLKNLVKGFYKDLQDSIDYGGKVSVLDVTSMPMDFYISFYQGLRQQGFKKFDLKTIKNPDGSVRDMMIVSYNPWMFRFKKLQIILPEVTPSQVNAALGHPGPGAEVFVMPRPIKRSWFNKPEYTNNVIHVDFKNKRIKSA